MTLVVALQGQHEIVMAADSMAHGGDAGGMYKFRVSKLRSVGSHWLAGFAGTSIGYELHRQIEREGFDTSGSIHEAVHKYAARMRELYEGRDYRGDAAVILAGVSNEEPGVYEWALNRDGQDRVDFRGARQQPHWSAIGASQHGALYFANAFHNAEMETKLRILLAYFCVSEATNHDPRVGGNIEVARITENGVRIFSQGELAVVQRESKAIADCLARRFSTGGPSIPGL